MRNEAESQKIIDESNKRKVAFEQQQTEVKAKAAEAERIANKVYPLEYNGKPIYYTKDFIEYVKNTPELNDFQWHWYETAYMPRLKWQTRINEYNPDSVEVINGPLQTFEILPDG